MYDIHFGLSKSVDGVRESSTSSFKGLIGEAAAYHIERVLKFLWVHDRNKNLH